MASFPTRTSLGCTHQGCWQPACRSSLEGSCCRDCPLSEVLRAIGSGSLALGRLFEGHVNAIELVLRYGNHEQAGLVAQEARQGKLFGVGTRTVRTICG